MQTQIILLYGSSGTGKSTLGRLLAGLMPRCAFIEVDTLRYMIVGGLVAESGGISPSKAPEEYHRQCWLGVGNAVGLAERFANEGFSSVIEGLEDDCRPGTGWIERSFLDIPFVLWLWSVQSQCCQDVGGKEVGPITYLHKQ